MIKTIHIMTVIVSFSLFFLRGVWMLEDSNKLHRTWVRVLPHINDTLLLASAVALAFTTRQYPGADPWLTAKVCGLFIYILLGMVALRWGRSRGIRLTAWFAAMLVFIYIIAVAISREPFPFTFA